MPSFSARVKEDTLPRSAESKTLHLCRAGRAGACLWDAALSGAGGFRLKLLTEHKSVVTRIFSGSVELPQDDTDPQLRQSSSPLQKEIYELRIQPADPPAFLEDLAIPFALPFLHRFGFAAFCGPARRGRVPGGVPARGDPGRRRHFRPEQGLSHGVHLRLPRLGNRLSSQCSRTFLCMPSVWSAKAAFPPI